MGLSIRVKLAVHGKIFKPTSVTNLSAFSNNFLKSKVNDTFLMTKIKFPFQNVISLTIILKIMHLKPFKNFTYSVVFQTKASSYLRREENKAMKSFEGSFRNLNFSPSTSILLNFFFPFIDVRCFFFSSLKLQYCRTIVLLNKLKLFKETSFSKATMVMRFPAKKNAVAYKHRTNSSQEKMAFSTPRSGCFGTPLPLPQSLYGRTLMSQPKFLGSIGY